MPSAPRRQYLVAFVFVSAEFEMRDGGTFPGYVRAASENWGGAPPVRTRANGSILRLRPLSVRFGGPLAILGIQQPKIFVRGRRLVFGEAFAEYQRKIVPCFTLLSENLPPRYFQYASAQPRNYLRVYCPVSWRDFIGEVSMGSLLKLIFK